MQPVPQPDRREIEAAIKRVQAGELSPTEATELLLGASQPKAVGTSQPEDAGTIAELIDRLGPPPKDITDQWCRQARNILLRLPAESAELIRPASLSDWLIDAEGQLRFRGHSGLSETEYVATDTLELARAARDYLVQFRSLMSDQTAPPDLTHQGIAPPDPANDGSARDMNRPDERPVESNPSAAENEKRRWPTVVVGMLFGISLIVIALILYQASRSGVDPVAASSGNQRPVRTRPSTPGIDDEFDPLDHTLSGPGVSGFADDSGELESGLTTFDAAGISAESDSVTAGSTAAMSLDDIIPEIPMLALDAGQSQDDSDAQSRDASAETDSRSDRGISPDSPADTTLPGKNAPAGDDPLKVGGDENAPAESPQPTRVASVSAIELPPRDDFAAKRLVVDGQIPNPILDFPFDVALRLQAQVAGPKPDGANQQPIWSIMDEQAEIVIARVMQTQDAAWFQWTADAKRSTLANSLAHGRLRDAAKRTIYLRPSIEADAWQINFDRPDSRPTWDLVSTIPARVARISIDLVSSDSSDEAKADEIEIGWIEPVEIASPRRTRGLAVLTPKDGETVAVGLRFDIRCSRKLSCRVRTFGRLDPKSPWQLISRPMLDQVADQLTNQATRLSQMSTQIDALYSKSDTDQRRVLGPRRDAVDQQYDRVVMASNRVAELWALVGQIETDIDVMTRVWVQWPDSQQELLSTASADN